MPAAAADVLPQLRNKLRIPTFPRAPRASCGALFVRREMGSVTRIAMILVALKRIKVLDARSGAKRGLQMSCKLTACSALAAILLASSPSWAMQTVNGTTSSNGSLRLADPVKKDAKDEDAAKKGGITLNAGPNSVNTPYGPTNPAVPFGQQRYTPDTARGAPTASSFDDPTFGPNGTYTPGLHGNNPRP